MDTWRRDASEVDKQFLHGLHDRLVKVDVKKYLAHAKEEPNFAEETYSKQSNITQKNTWSRPIIPGAIKQVSMWLMELRNRKYRRTRIMAKNSIINKRIKTAQTIKSHDRMTRNFISRQILQTEATIIIIT